MRDVILARKDSKVEGRQGSLQMSHYETAYTADVGGIPVTARSRLALGRGEGQEQTKKTKSRKFRFVNTHLEAFGDPTIREAQAIELTEEKAALKTSKPVDPRR